MFAVAFITVFVTISILGILGYGRKKCEIMLLYALRPET